MVINFYKYQGTGNDFIIVDNRQLDVDKNDTKRIKELCDRRFGIGADGFILLENDDLHDFKMVYFNADGRESSMCGNGGRCIASFAKMLGIIQTEASFTAIDGLHKAIVGDDLVQLQMQEVSEVRDLGTHVFLDTGSPHHVTIVKDVKSVGVVQEGAAIRYSELYGEAGSNVNFVEQVAANTFSVRTYERGVENETLSCGTGVTAVALAMHTTGRSESDDIKLITQGGELRVTFRPGPNGYRDIWLIGPIELVFKGSVEW